MPTVTFLPFNQKCEASEGETLLEVALNHDIPIQHACGGFCSCTTCHCIVKEQKEGLADMEEDEEETLTRAEGWTPDSRLACQAKVRGNVTVQVVNIDE